MRGTILQIDDEPGISAALAVRLRAVGFEVVTATDGPSGLAAAEAHRPAAILLDIRMPGMDGYEVCRRLKAHPELRHVPVIFLSANTKEEARRTAREAGGAAFISKPYEARDLVAAIDAVTAGLEARPRRCDVSGAS